MRSLPIAAFVLCACTVCPKDWEARDGECVQREPWPSACPEVIGELSTDGELFAGQSEISGTESILLEDQAALDEFLDGMEFPPDLPPVDFGSSVVLGLAHGISSTCGASITDHGLAGGSTLVVQIGDRSATCPDQCDMDMQFLVLYAVSRDAADPTSCVEVVGTCSSGYQ